MKRFENPAKFISFSLILIISLIEINKILEPKFILQNSEWPTTSSYNQFYKMNRESIDVIFLGSSVAASAFIPQEIYNDFGITSYNLASEQQSIFLSYYWLKEALRYQNPKIVILDARFVSKLHPESPINTTEGLTRKCLDPMKWSGVKREAVHKLCELDTTQSELSYYLTNIRFHTRWSDLKECDFNKKMSESSYDMRGYVPITSDGPETYITYEQEDTEIRAEFHPLMMEYLDKTVNLCKQNNIHLILVDLPGNNMMNDGVNNSLTEYASDKGIDYYNLCKTEYYNRIGAVLPHENIIIHENVWGAIKLSKFIGDMLLNDYGLEPVMDEQYETTKPNYEHTINNANLVRITDPVEYLQNLKDQNYAVFIVAHGDSSRVLAHAPITNAMIDLGLQCSFVNNPKCSYVAVINGEGIEYEEVSEEPIKYTGCIKKPRLLFELESDGSSSKASSSVIIGGEQSSKMNQGLNIVVYDKATYRIIDSVTFNTDHIIR